MLSQVARQELPAPAPNAPPPRGRGPQKRQSRQGFSRLGAAARFLRGPRAGADVAGISRALRAVTCRCLLARPRTPNPTCNPCCSSALAQPAPRRVPRSFADPMLRRGPRGRAPDRSERDVRPARCVLLAVPERHAVEPLSAQGQGAGSRRCVGGGRCRWRRGRLRRRRRHHHHANHHQSGRLDHDDNDLCRRQHATTTTPAASECGQWRHGGQSVRQFVQRRAARSTGQATVAAGAGGQHS